MPQLYSAGKLPRAYLAKKWVIAGIVQLGKQILKGTGRVPGLGHMPSNSLEWSNVAAMGLITPGGYEKLQDLVP